ncbi:MAG: hypothetical protein UU46_C0003G0038 [Candidatus Uhrbacteria bacterium GW2011_GWD1_41_16]|uniref:Uncharacterized protein n=1 Tax=Candidatus Uhrbacteria bacterium GW2011_GWC1_41_20 TaxID=1618983 RepID=A0A0G0XR95_9BACT|nr:MAG: hypothetical protein UT52_C0005G0002 [Candidatus Uhrbacteria bacterium GW2011_GWE1_39_46]KKR63649.1 MAG: hypothetical protein UU04_C0015G0038 [Candidatus Uhrbacteria bacterium GW2011_GWC2_40_450]KKR96421.1 MAG: hypothetical protein UU46_C0003G0038 [Candidatus Uhrbacteria bacterium GW2011_GWD1_41_16]KKR99435.1 MAG: hypothetical protein UU50_C0006G0038 [Candidatus Uhrbacteria bacterium GW2011_GWC1_41_20]KKS08332.1 MAG: hypothetical protein UU62_C0002G0002 [Candidatus Uhrbacteria bacterium
MEKKKSFIIYYLLLCEGTTEYNLFAYITRNKFRGLFDKSNIKFSDRVQIVKSNVSQGKLNGAGTISSFKAKYDSIKKKYSGQTLFFVLDKDLDDSSRIETMIQAGGDIVQFLICNSEHLLLKLAGKSPKEPSDFITLKDFRDYCKAEFLKQFGKDAPRFKDFDFDLVFNNCTEDEIRANFTELFATTE